MSLKIQTHHCICTTFNLTTPQPLASLPKRTLDKAIICPTTTWETLSPTTPCAILTNLETDTKPTVLRLEDGFELRYGVRCVRCGVMVGYRLDKRQFGGGEGVESGVVFLLEGGLRCTEEVEGKGKE